MSVISTSKYFSAFDFIIFVKSLVTNELGFNAFLDSNNDIISAKHTAHAATLANTRSAYVININLSNKVNPAIIIAANPSFSIVDQNLPDSK